MLKWSCELIINLIEVKLHKLNETYDIIICTGIIDTSL